MLKHQPLAGGPGDQLCITVEHDADPPASLGFHHPCQASCLGSLFCAFWCDVTLALTLVTLAYHPPGWPSHTLAEAQGLRMLGPHHAELGELLRPTLSRSTSGAGARLGTARGHPEADLKDRSFQEGKSCHALGVPPSLSWRACHVPCSVLTRLPKLYCWGINGEGDTLECHPWSSVPVLPFSTSSGKQSVIPIPANCKFPLSPSPYLPTL